MSALEVFTFPATGHEVRVVVGEAGPRFVLADLCAGLAIANARDVARRLPDARKGVDRIDTLGGPQSMTTVDEAGAYMVVMRSDKREAVAFQEWLAEVATEIRRTGSYSVARIVDPLDEIEAANDRASRAVALARAERQRAIEAEARAVEGEQFKAAIEGGDGLTLRAFHKKHFSDVRETTFFGVLYDKGLLIDQLGKGTRRADGTVRNGAQHRHPTYLGKPYFYLHTTTNDRGRRFENTRVRPGQPELELRAYLVKAGLTANTSTDLELAR